MKFLSIISSIISLLFFGCQNSEKKIPTKKQETASLYILDSVPKTRLILNSDSTFKFIKINQNPFMYMFDRVDLSFFTTSGNWRIKGSDLILNSNNDSSSLPTVDVRLDSVDNLKFSTFRFYDIYNDSVASWTVGYPNGTSADLGSDMRDHIFEWSEDMIKVKSVKFVFTGYGHWKYSSPDGLNHNVSVHFAPLRRANFFENAIFKIHGDTLIDSSRKRAYYFIKKGN